MKLPFNLIEWIQENKNLLKPPVGNKVLLESNDFIVMAVGGYNKRDDFHINKTEEIFFQLEGSINLKTINKDNVVEDISINPGEIISAARRSSPLPAKTRRYDWYCHRKKKKMKKIYFNGDVIIAIM